jgi:hypothetical protein
MAEKKYITRAQLDAVAAGLGKLKKKEEERFTLKAAIQQISPLITEALIKGFDYADIAAILLRDHGIEIKPDTLRSYHKAALASDGGSKVAPRGEGRPGGSDKPSGKQVPSTATGAQPTLTDSTEGKFIMDPPL